MLAAPPAVRGFIADGESRDAVALDWEALRDETDADTGTSFTDATDQGERQYVHRVWPHNDRGISRYSWRGDWAFNGGDPGGYPVEAPYVPPPPAQQSRRRDAVQEPGQPERRTSATPRRWARR